MPDAVAAAESWLLSDPSSGYLEDAIAGWGIWCKKENPPSSYCLDQEVIYIKILRSLHLLNLHTQVQIVKLLEI